MMGLMSRRMVRRRGVAALTAVVLVAALSAAGSPGAVAAAPCSLAVSASLKTSTHIAGGATMRRYVARVGGPVTDKYDQKAKVIVSRFPEGVVPRLIHVKLGDRAGTGNTVRTHAPHALVAVNGDFFPERRIRGESVTLARGPMILDGTVVRASARPKPVVGVTNAGAPFGGLLGIRGSVSVGADLGVRVLGVNWNAVRRHGATVFTSDWSDASSTPRPAGTTEWVLNSADVIARVRTARVHRHKRGATVAENTRVVAFVGHLARTAARAQPGDVVSVSIRQRTLPRVRLQTAVGRGLRLVRNGVAAPLDCGDYLNGARPRTVVGWTRGGLWRAITVPGSEFVGEGLRVGGFGLAQVAHVARRMGLVNAFELDGGGSTTLYTRTSRVWSRRDLWGVKGGNYERPVPNGLAFVAR